MVGRLKGIIKGKDALAAGELEFIDVKEMVNLTKTAKLPQSQLQKQRELESVYNKRNPSPQSSVINPSQLSIEIHSPTRPITIAENRELSLPPIKTAKH